MIVYALDWMDDSGGRREHFLKLADAERREAEVIEELENEFFPGQVFGITKHRYPVSKLGIIGAMNDAAALVWK